VRLARSISLAPRICARAWAHCSSVQSRRRWKPPPPAFQNVATTFDPLGAGASGLPVAALDYLFLALIAVTIVVSVQTVGIILIVAMLVTPAATAQLLTSRFSSMIVIAIAVGVISPVVGLYVSYWLDTASGATMVLVETAVFLAALALGPRTGLLRVRRAPAG